MRTSPRSTGSNQSSSPPRKKRRREAGRAGAPLKIATRKSQLALWQAEHVAALLRAAHPGIRCELLPMSTKGDRILDRSLAAIGGKGLFIKELEAALEDRRADSAVHSMKDVPGGPSRRIGDRRGAAARRRARRADRDERPAIFRRLRAARALGTSSLRRQAQLLAVRPGPRDRGPARQCGFAPQRLDARRARRDHARLRRPHSARPRIAHQPRGSIPRSRSRRSARA